LLTKSLYNGGIFGVILNWGDTEMFGYVSIYKPDMKVRDYNTYKAYYCGLCRELKKSYPAARVTLSYDCAFLYVLIAGIKGAKPEYTRKVCVSNPVKKQTSARDTGVEFAAAANVLLTAGKLKDGIRDGGGIKYKAADIAISGAEKKARKAYPALAEIIDQKLLELWEAEAAKEASVDKMAGIFGELLEGVFREAELGRAAERLGYYIGRWIYIADAYADIEEDLEKGNYNPYILHYGKEAAKNKKENIFPHVEFNMNCSINEARAALSLTDMQSHREIIENIVFEGINHTMKVIEEGKRPKKKHMEGEINGSV